MLHASGSTPRALDRLAKCFAAAGFATELPVVQPAASAASNTPDPFAECIASIAATLAHANPRRRLLFGHSMGGLVAIKTLLAGAKADAAILFEPIVLSLLDPERAEDRAARAWDAAVIDDVHRAMASGAAELGMARFVEAYGETPWSAIPPAARQDLIRRAPAILGEAEATNRAAIPREALAALSLPVLVLSGSRSPNVLNLMSRHLVAALPRADRRVLDGLGHMGPVLHPSSVAGAALEFLGNEGFAA